MNEWAKVHGRPDDREVFDLMLAHIPTNKVEGAYNRAAYMPPRRELARIWANVLVPGLKEPVSLIGLPCKGEPVQTLENRSPDRSPCPPPCPLRLVSYRQVDECELLWTSMETKGFELSQQVADLALF